MNFSYNEHLNPYDVFYFVSSCEEIFGINKRIFLHTIDSHYTTLAFAICQPFVGFCQSANIFFIKCVLGTKFLPYQIQYSSVCTHHACMCKLFVDYLVWDDYSRLE